VCQEYHVKFPEQLDIYGGTTTKIWVKQKAPTTGGTFQVLSHIHHKFSVFVPYPEKYVNINIEAENVNVNEPVQIKINAMNYGNKKVEKANARLDIYGADDYSNYLTSLHTNTKPLESMESVDFYSNFETFGVVPGYYKVDVEFFYDNNMTDGSEIFRIGTLLVKINNYTRTAVAGKINPYDIDVESRWNNEIKSVYGKVVLNGVEKEVLTSTVSLQPWEKIKLKNYVDLTEKEPGEYDGVINIYFDDETISKDVSLMVESEAQVIPEEPAVALDEPEESTWIKNLTMTNILLLIILIIIIIDILYIYYKKKREDE